MQNDSTYVLQNGKPEHQIELYDPKHPENGWVLGPAQQIDRAYHSTAVLLPDGRVLSAGDDNPYVYNPPVGVHPASLRGLGPQLGRDLLAALPVPRHAAADRLGSRVRGLRRRVPRRPQPGGPAAGARAPDPAGGLTHSTNPSPRIVPLSPRPPRTGSTSPRRRTPTSPRRATTCCSRSTPTACRRWRAGCASARPTRTAAERCRPRPADPPPPTPPEPPDTHPGAAAEGRHGGGVGQGGVAEPLRKGYVVAYLGGGEQLTRASVAAPVVRPLEPAPKPHRRTPTPAPRAR